MPSREGSTAKGGGDARREIGTPHRDATAQCATDRTVVPEPLTSMVAGGRPRLSIWY